MLTYPLVTSCLDCLRITLEGVSIPTAAGTEKLNDVPGMTQGQSAGVAIFVVDQKFGHYARPCAEQSLGSILEAPGLQRYRSRTLGSAIVIRHPDDHFASQAPPHFSRSAGIAHQAALFHDQGVSLSKISTGVLAPLAGKMAQ